ncbi:hypothetical protein M885DRAFT_558880 [Pelagophyceae sp. CCMP2097]|nr:hypothetical protein M885DRAFT_558880 [Pelagophyceae sp. CCMP2097]
MPRGQTRYAVLLLVPHWALLLWAMYHSAVGRVVTISNIIPRVDTSTGLPLQLGDGSLIQVGLNYYLYGVRYVCAPSPACHAGGNCNRTDIRVWRNMTFGVAKSTDLMHWNVLSYDVLPEMRSGPFPNTEFAWFMPTAAWAADASADGSVFALWFYIDEVSRGVATAKTPMGPFSVVHYAVPNLQLGSDLFLWRGAFGGYFAKHNGGCHQGISPPAKGSGVCVSRLSANLTDIEQRPRVQA